jgi:hypothetical protein
MLNRLRSELENELKPQVHEDEFKRLKESHPSFESFRTAQELIGFLGAGGDHEQKDETLAILIKEYGGELPLRIAGTILILSFFPVIKNLYFAQCHRYGDCEELISILQCCFLEAARNYPLDKRPRKIAANLKFLTLRSFIESQSELSEADEFQRHLLDEAEKYRPDAEQLSESYPGIAPTAVTDRESIDMTIRNYHIFVDAGVVDKDDFMLIVETRVFDRDLQEVSGEMGIGIETAWKRRKRAEQAMKEDFKKYFLDSCPEPPPKTGV